MLNAAAMMTTGSTITSAGMIIVANTEYNNTASSIDNSTSNSTGASARASSNCHFSGSCSAVNAAIAGAAGFAAHPAALIGSKPATACACS
jgi:hypothetical protein